MKFKFTGKYKSIADFESEELSDFTVITGKNGTGKSQLINCIDSRTKSNIDKSFDLIFEPDFKRIKISDLVYKSAGPASTQTVKVKLDKLYQSFTQIRPKHKKLFGDLLERDVHLSNFIDFDQVQLNEFLGITDSKAYASDLLSESPVPGHISLPEKVIFQNLKRSLSEYISLFDILSSIKNYRKKSLYDFDRNDFSKTPLPDKHIDISDMFESQVETIFFNYLKRRHENQYLNFRNITYGEQNDVIEDIEFEQAYPAPWDIINKILSENKIPLTVRNYHTSEYSEDITINVSFKKEGISDLISFSDLSSGEQVIIGLVIKLFTEKYYETDLAFPELIVLDEPDAYLHPEMSKLLIDVLYKSFVLDLGVKVIMTTHSPSTIALTPEDCIFKMSNNPICSLKKISKDSALEILTGMIPTLSIDYKNHKQVFLESPTDVTYFQVLFNKLNSEEQLNYKLYFISNEMGKSNSDWVKATVAKLREGGVVRSFGIIDWDDKNRSSTEILVHGEGNRYSVENFLYDAVYMAILFLEQNGANNIKSELIFDITYNQYNLITETEQRLQEIWDWFIDKVEEKYPTLKSNSTLFEIFYYNGKKVFIPNWLRKIQGHELETKLKIIFPSLSKFTSEGELQSKLSIIMAKCYPLVPLDSIALIKKLCL
jgi:predicted ATPase